MSICLSKLSANVNSNCADFKPNGYERIGYIINREDIDWTNSGVENGNQATIVMKSSMKPKAIFQSPNKPFNGSTIALNKGTYVNTFTNTIQFVIFGAGMSNSAVANKIANGEFVVLLEHKTKDASSSSDTEQYEVFGMYQGLVCSDIQRNEYDDDSNGGYVVTLVEERAVVAGLYMEASDVASLISGVVTGS